MNPVAWILLGALGGAGLAFLAFLGLVWTWIRDAEVGVDPFASLPLWDDDTDRELDDLLAGGA